MARTHTRTRYTMHKQNFQDQLKAEENARIMVVWWKKEYTDWAMEVAGEEKFIELWEGMNWDGRWVDIEADMKELEAALMIAAGTQLNVSGALDALQVGG